MNQTLTISQYMEIYKGKRGKKCSGQYIGRLCRLKKLPDGVTAVLMGKTWIITIENKEVK